MHMDFSESWINFYHFFRIFNLDFLWVLILQKCIGSRYLVPINSSHSFRLNLLKLYMDFKNGLKICMWFSRNPEIIFYHFFRIFNLDTFWVLMLQKRIGSRYLVPVTPTTVLSRSFWNFTDALRMVWRYAYGFFQNPEIIFYYFLHILNLDIFWVPISQKSTGSRYFVPLTPPAVFGRFFWNFTWVFRMAWIYACGFFRILK